LFLRFAVHSIAFSLVASHRLILRRNKRSSKSGKPSLESRHNRRRKNSNSWWLIPALEIKSPAQWRGSVGPGKLTGQRKLLSPRVEGQTHTKCLLLCCAFGSF
jgi:hypothetical protein